MRCSGGEKSLNVIVALYSIAWVRLAVEIAIVGREARSRVSFLEEKIGRAWNNTLSTTTTASVGRPDWPRLGVIFTTSTEDSDKHANSAPCFATKDFPAEFLKRRCFRGLSWRTRRRLVDMKAKIRSFSRLLNLIRPKNFGLSFAPLLGNYFHFLDRHKPSVLQSCRLFQCTTAKFLSKRPTHTHTYIYALSFSLYGKRQQIPRFFLFFYPWLYVPAIQPWSPISKKKTFSCHVEETELVHVTKAALRLLAQLHFLLNRRLNRNCIFSTSAKYCIRAKFAFWHEASSQRKIVWNWPMLEKEKKLSSTNLGVWHCWQVKRVNCRHDG